MPDSNFMYFRFVPSTEICRYVHTNKYVCWCLWAEIFFFPVHETWGRTDLVAMRLNRKVIFSWAFAMVGAGQLYALLTPTLPVLICDCSVWLGSPSPFSVGCVMRALMSRGTCTCDGVRWPEMSSSLTLYLIYWGSVSYWPDPAILANLHSISPRWSLVAASWVLGLQVAAKLAWRFSMS